MKSGDFVRIGIPGFPRHVTAKYISQSSTSVLVEIGDERYILPPFSKGFNPANGVFFCNGGWQNSPCIVKP